MFISLNLLCYIYNGLLYLEKGMMYEESTEYLWEGFVAVPLHSTSAAYRLRREWRNVGGTIRIDCRKQCVAHSCERK